MLSHVAIMAATVDCTAFSSDGKYLAYSTPNGRLLVWETRSGDLKQEYIPSSHLSSTCTCLSWNSCASSESSSPKKKKKRKSDPTENAIDGLDLLAMGTASGSILLYSASTGDLHAHLKDGHTGKVNGVAWHAPSDSLFSCSVDQHITHWNISSNKLKYKWKGDENEIYSICVVDHQHMLTASRSIKLWDTEKRAVLKKLVGHATEICWLLPIRYPEKSFEESYVFSSALNDRVINAWQLRIDGDTHSIASCSISDEPLQLDVSKPVSRDQPIMLTAVTQNGTLHVFEHQLNGKCSKPLQPKVTLQITTEGSEESAGRPEPIRVLAAHICNDVDQTILIMHGSFLRPTFERITFGECKKQTWLIRKEKLPTSSKQMTKIKQPEESRNAKVVSLDSMMPAGPQPSTSKSPRKRKLKGEVNQLPMEERLNALSLEVPGKSTTKTATSATTPRSDSMVYLLLQGLQSNDKRILDSIFQKGDAITIENTVRRLPIESIRIFMHELLHRLRCKGENVYKSLKWLKCLLLYHASYLITCSDCEDISGPLHELLASRTEKFEKICRLQGRLDLMLSQIKQKDEAIHELPAQPLLVYQDVSSSDEEVELTQSAPNVKQARPTDIEINGLHKTSPDIRQSEQSSSSLDNSEKEESNSDGDLID